MCDKKIFLWDNISFLMDKNEIKSVRELGRKIETNHSSISKYKESQTLPSLKIVLKFCEEFKTSIDELLYEDLKEQETIIEGGKLVLDEIEVKSIKRKLLMSLDLIEERKKQSNYSIELPRLIKNSKNPNTEEFLEMIDSYINSVSSNGVFDELDDLSDI